PGWGSSYPENLTPFDGALFFSATDASVAGLWRTDGTETGTERVFEGAVYSVGTMGGALYFLGDPPPGYSSWLRALWRSDGTAAGTVPLGTFYGPSGNPRLTGLTAAGPYIYFRADWGNLWRSDGTPEGTFQVGPNSLNPQELTRVGDILYLSGNSYWNDLGRELWRSDGTPEGTYMVADVNPGRADSQPGRLTDVNGTLFFWAAHAATGFELWKSDGTAPGTVLVRDIDPTDVTVPSYFQALGNFLYFTAQTPSFG